MIILINGGPQRNRLGSSQYVGRLVSPRCGNRIRPGETWAADNDAFLAWDEQRFVDMLVRIEGIPGCVFVAAPDVVADARATMDRFWDWRIEIVGRGLPVALVAQDGLEDMDIPWIAFDALFLGGTTEWKLSASSANLAREAKYRGKWLHVGRVNTRRRLRQAYDIGADSIDGTGWSRFPDHYLRTMIPFVRSLHAQQLLL